MKDQLGHASWLQQHCKVARTGNNLERDAERFRRRAPLFGGSTVSSAPHMRADLFAWTPDRRYDVVFFGSWISHVPLDRFEAFWSFVADCLQPTGRVFFIDDAYRTPDELIEGEASSTIRRRLNDGSAYRAVKVPHRPAELEDRLRGLGWQIKVTATCGPCFWGQRIPTRSRAGRGNPEDRPRPDHQLAR